MNSQQWKSIFDTFQYARTLLEDHLPLSASENPRKQKLPRGDAQKLLLELNALLMESVKELEHKLLGSGNGLSAEEHEEVLRPFVYLLDELVQQRLADTQRSEEWPLLQYQRFHEDSGGDLFFELAERQLNDPGPSPLIFEMLHFCLTAGFRGRHGDRPAKLHEYKQRLAKEIPQPKQGKKPPLPVTTGATELPEIPYRYYVVTGFFVLALPVVLWWSSR